MAEFNPYKLEEEKWTPKNIYEILPPNAVSWSDYDFGQGTDNVDQEAAKKSLIDGFVDFFKELLGTAGQILGGAIDLGVGIFAAFAEGISNFIGEIADAIGGVFTHDGQRSKPIYDAIIAQMGPVKTQVNTLGQHLEEMSTEVNEKIDTQKGLIDDANTAIDEAVSVTAAVKKLADENKAKVADAVSKADKANADLALLSPKVADAVDKASKASSDVSALTPKVSAAQSKADSAYTEAENVRSEVTPKIEDAQTKGESALAVADKAVDWLKNPVEIGSSLIALDVETKEPHYLQWAGKPATASTEGLPFAKAVRVDSSTETRFDAPDGARVPVKVNPDLTYKWSMWVYSNKPGTNITLLTTSDSIGLCVEETTYKQDDSVIASKWGILLKDIPKGWSKQEGTIKFQQATDNVRLFSVEWNKTGVADTQQWLAALDIVPDVPTQASVDKAQNDAIKANQDILRQQEEINEAQRQFNTFHTQFTKDQLEWNDAVDRSITTQDTVNKNFQKWTDGATKAIEANTTAIAALNAPDSGASLMPTNPLTNEPYYVQWAGTRALLSDGVPERVGVRQTSTKQVRYDAKGDDYVLSKLNKGTVYRWSVWVYSSVADSDIRFLLMDPESWLVSRNIKGDEGVTVPNSKYGILLTKVPKGWSKQSGTIEFEDEADYIYLYAVEWNYGDRDVVQYFGGLDIYPDVPTQAQVDDAQNKAIQAGKEFDKQQTEINDLVQEQLWAQLDMIEQLDIQTPRVLHYRTAEGDFEPAPDWTTWKHCRYHESPFILHLSAYMSTKKMYWMAKGRWEGKLKVTTNWTNGATDVMVYDITRDEANAMASRKQSTKLGKKARAYAELGGAWGTDLRNSTFEIYPTHLGRSVGIRNTGSGWSVDESVMETGGPSLIRHQTKDVIRFTNSVVCNKGVFITPPPPQGGYNITAGTIISPRKFDRKNFEVGVTYIFTEKPFTTNTW